MPSTPPRKRSLFLRGYDRATFQSGEDSASSSKQIKPRTLLQRSASILLILGLVFILASMFSLGLNAAHGNNQPITTANSQLLRQPPSPSEQKRFKVAVAITVTKDGPYLDGAAVLQHSVRMTNSFHDVEMVAIVHSEVQSTRPALQALGFRIVEFPLPVLSKDIKGKHLRETIDKSGCCGAQELLKLCSWMLLDYDRVVAMDMDAIWLANLDHLLERDLPAGGFLFTYDFAMDNPQSKAPPVQGGFQLIRPDEHTFNQLVDIVREGDFQPGTGWGGLNIGWCWGGQTIQGLLAYFAAVVQPDLAFPLDPCVYNSMATTRECRRQEYALVQSIHYTYCQKPWDCHTGQGICARFLHAWWMVRTDLEKQQGLPSVGRCCHDKQACEERTYKQVDVANMRALPMSNNANPPLPQGQHIVHIPSTLHIKEPSITED